MQNLLSNKQGVETAYPLNFNFDEMQAAMKARHELDRIPIINTTIFITLPYKL